MGKSNIKIREDEMWCPECGAPIKQGFLTCSNCRLKVRMTQDIIREQGKKSKKKPKKKQAGQVKKEAAVKTESGPAKEKEEPVKEEIIEKIPADKKEDIPVKENNTQPSDKLREGTDSNPVNKEGHPRYWNF